jgi:zinc protease
LTHDEKVTAWQLDNGLQVLLRQVFYAPVASCWIWYRVGSRNEIPGQTGISHWVEHMMFKGTPTFPKGSIMRTINKFGGTLNGFTSQDYTAYYETLPADHLDLAVRIEADRMANAVFDPDEVQSERTVIISERQGNENSPTFLLAEELSALAFRLHPYGHQIIGSKEDLMRLTRDELWQHYRRYYGPHNAVLVLAGAIEEAQARALVTAHFGPIPPGETPPPVRAVEPPQHGERRVSITQPGAARYFRAAFHVPAGKHPDSLALAVLDAVLSGSSALAVGSGSTPTHRSARLYRALVETNLAAKASSGSGLNIDPGLFRFNATARDGRQLEEVEMAIWDQVHRLQDELVSPEELLKARKQARAQFAYALESVTNQAMWLGMWEMVDSHRRVFTILDELATVTAEEVQRVAQTYLVPSNRSVGWAAPEKG